MKSKRSGCLHKQDSQGSKKKQSVNQGSPVGNADNDAAKKQQNECDGCCSIDWKPVGVHG